MSYTEVGAYAGGTGGSGLPQPIPTNVKQTIHPDGAGGAAWRQSTADDLGTALLSTLVLSTTALVQRGATLSSVTAASVNTPTGSVTSASLATTYSGATDGGDVNLGAWSTSAPFTSASAAGTVKRNAAGGTDPRMTVTRTYSDGSSTKTVSDTTDWTYRVYAGPSSVAVLNEAQIEALASMSHASGGVLQQDLAGPTQAAPINYTMTLNDEYAHFCSPDLSPWNGTLVVRQNGIIISAAINVVGTVSVTNSDGVACNYQDRRSDTKLTGTITFAFSRT